LTARIIQSKALAASTISLTKSNERTIVQTVKRNLVFMGVIAFFVSAPLGRATQQQDSSVNSKEVQELHERVVKLKAQVASLEKQTKALEQRRVLTIPGPQLPQGSQMPPGSKQVEFNGL
jgi:hypothetical protein